MIALVSIVACAPWVKVGGPYKSASHKFSIDLPEKWMRLNTDQFLLTTRDGTLLQNIYVKRSNIEKEFKYTKKTLSKGMLPQEVADVILDDISSNKAILNLEVIENVPAVIDGHDGFKILYSFKNKDGLGSKSILYGFLLDEWCYVIRYTAASRHYHDKDKGTFTNAFSSFKLIN